MKLNRQRLVWGLAIALVSPAGADVIQLANGGKRDGSIVGYQNLTFEFADKTGQRSRLPMAQIKRIDFDSAAATLETRTQGTVTGTLKRFENSAFVLQTEQGKEQTVQAMLVKEFRVSGAGAGGGSGKAVDVIARGSRVELSQHLALGKVTIVDFYADWCGPCRAISPYLEKLARDDQDVVLRKVDIVNWGSPVAKQHEIRSIPHIRVYDRKGNLVGTVSGASQEAVRQLVAKAR